MEIHSFDNGGFVYFTGNSATFELNIEDTDFSGITSGTFGFTASDWDWYYSTTKGHYGGGVFSISCLSAKVTV